MRQSMNGVWLISPVPRFPFRFFISQPLPCHIADPRDVAGCAAVQSARRFQ